MKESQEDGDEWEELADNGQTQKSAFNDFMMEQVKAQAARGDPICGSLLSLESLVSDLYLGNEEELDEDFEI